MILQQLSEYYDRRIEGGDTDLPEEGMSEKAIDAAIVLDRFEPGGVPEIELLGDRGGKKYKPLRMMVPAEVKRASGLVANFLWDKSAYILGVKKAKDPASGSEVKVVMFHEDTVLVAGRGRKLYQATISGDMKAEVDMSSSVIYSLVKKIDPNVMCCAGSSSYIDILTNMYNYKDATIEFPVEE